MSKTNDTTRELRDDELENVSGGMENVILKEVVAPRDVSSGLRFSLGASNPTT
jgi:hypothetical protein